MAPRSSLELRALFLWSNGRRSGDVGAGRQHYLMNGERDAARRPRGARVGGRDARLDGRPQVLRPARHVAAHDAAAARVRRGRVRGRPRLRRLLDPRLAGDLRVGHAADARSELGDPRPLHRGADALARSARSSTRSRARATRATRARSRSAPRSTCARPGSPTPASSAPSASSSSSTRSATTLGPNAAHYAVDSARGLLELRQARASATRRGRRRATSRPAPHDSLHDLRTRDGADAGAARDPVRVPPPRGRLRRPVRDRPALPER